MRKVETVQLRGSRMLALRSAPAARWGKMRTVRWKKHATAQQRKAAETNHLPNKLSKTASLLCKSVYKPSQNHSA